MTLTLLSLVILSPSPSTANKVTEGLADLAREVTPGDLISVSNIRKSMGISPQPLTSHSASAITDNAADETEADEVLEPLENLPSAGTTSGSVAASHATEEDDEEDEEEEEEGEGAALGVGSVDGGLDETTGEAMVEEGVSQDPADLSEFFSSPPMPHETSMDEGS